MHADEQKTFETKTIKRNNLQKHAKFSSKSTYKSKIVAATEKSSLRRKNRRSDRKKNVAEIKKEWCLESAARGSSQIDLTRPEIQTVLKLCGTTGGMSKETMPKRPKHHRAQDPSIQGPRTRNPKTHKLKLEGQGKLTIQ